MSTNIVHCEHGYFTEPDGPCPHCLELATLHQRLAELKARHAKALACLKLIAEENTEFTTDAAWCAEQARRALEEVG